jgi:hypothetical protein
MDTERIAKAVLAGTGLLLFALLTRWMTDHERTADLFGVEAEGVWGASTLRADAAGLLLTTAAFVVTAAAAVGRVVGLRRDGFDPRSVATLLAEVVGLGALVVLWFGECSEE